MVTMALGGLWHGAAWTFVIWGVLHGLYLCINHAWNNFGPAIAPRFRRSVGLASFILTFLSVVIAWVFFRADSLSSALSILSKMADPRHIVLGRGEIAYIAFIIFYAAIAWFRPNTQAIMGYNHEATTLSQALPPSRTPPLF